MDVIIGEAHDPASLHPFKGNIDLDKLEELIGRVEAQNIPYVSLAGTVNMAGGQPVSMANVRALRDMDVVAEAVKAVYDAREQTRGFKMVYEPKHLHFFQARFEPME